ncbi:MAG: MarR family transcriptional regulator [Patescibacteria group bacterium]
MDTQILSTEDIALQSIDELQDRMERITLSFYKRMSSMSESSLSLIAFTALRYIHAYGPATVGKIFSAIARSQSTTSELLTRLRKHGLVEHNRNDKDGRVVNIRITGKGRSALASAEAKRDEAWRDLLGHLDENDRQTLIAAMRQICAIL